MVQLADGVCGVISTTGGAMDPYWLLLKAYSLFWLLPVFQNNIVHTPRGNIQTRNPCYQWMDVVPLCANAGKDRHAALIR